MMKKEEMTNNIKTKYTMQIQYANEGYVNCHETNANNTSCLQLEEQPTLPNNPPTRRQQT